LEDIMSKPARAPTYLLIVGLVSACLAAAGCEFLDEVPEEGSVYRLRSNEEALMRMYEARLARWPVDFEDLDVGTSYGTAHLIASGPRDGPPVVMLHAMGLNATMWLVNISALSAAHRVYALDTIGDLGKSRLDDHDLYPRDGREMAGWLVEVLDGLGIERAAVVGSSMGGWIALNAAVHAPDRVGRLILLGPVGLRSPLGVLYRLFSFMLFPTESNKRKMIAWTLGDSPAVRSEFEEYMMTALDCRGRLPIPKTLSDDDLRSIEIPVLLILGENDNPVPDPAKQAERARGLVPDVRVEVIPGAGHLMNVERPGQVDKMVLDFLES
jgi:pimeloyl-ACP methyl ester carboxylesterase